MELQMVLGGKAVELGEDDYALGAYLLYTSIIDVFLKIVQLLGLADDWLVFLVKIRETMCPVQIYFMIYLCRFINKIFDNIIIFF